MGCSENPQLIKLIVMAQFAQMFPLLYLLSQHTYESVDSVQTSNNPSSWDTKGLDSQERLRPHFPPPEVWTYRHSMCCQLAHEPSWASPRNFFSWASPRNINLLHVLAYETSICWPMNSPCVANERSKRWLVVINTLF